MAEMQNLAARLHILPYVRFLGFRRDIPALIRAATATVLTSSHEGVPRSLMESLSLEVPGIGVEIRGIRELLSDGCGVLTPPNDSVALSRALAQLASDREQAQAMGRRGRRKMKNTYDLRFVIRAHEQLYAEALKCPQ